MVTGPRGLGGKARAMNIIEKFDQRAEKINSLLCVGLDPDFEKLPGAFKDKEFPQFEFNKWIIGQTAEFAAAFKANSAFYEARGEAGMRELKMTIDYIKQHQADIFTICDAKRGDIGNSNQGYVTAIFDTLGFDAVTINPYLGKEALKPFLNREDKASIILCRTSDLGAEEFQDLLVDGKPIWQIVAQRVANEWNSNHNCMLVVGATFPEEMKIVRSIAPEMTMLVPGIGAQGGEVKASVEAGLNSKKLGMIVNSARGIIFAENPGEAAKNLRDEINKYR